VKVRETPIPGVLVIEPTVFKDHRGAFLEVYRDERYAEVGIKDKFCQDNLSLSREKVLRGLHLQNPHGQAKLVSVLRGEAWDVCVDLRVGSPTFGHWHAELLSEENFTQIYIPAGFGHGFCVLGGETVVSYKCSDAYSAASELTVIWNDPDLAIEWPISEPEISEKDAAGLTVRQLIDRLPQY
jgi:dTDP-4-dehydrorhamnose 3,5-epimerase